jgi:hypothetical protein
MEIKDNKVPGIARYAFRKQLYSIRMNLLFLWKYILKKNIRGFILDSSGENWRLKTPCTAPMPFLLIWISYLDRKSSSLSVLFFVYAGSAKPSPQQGGGDVSGGGNYGEREAAAPAHSRG